MAKIFTSDTMQLLIQ